MTPNVEYFQCQRNSRFGNGAVLTARKGVKFLVMALGQMHQIEMFLVPGILGEDEWLIPGPAPTGLGRS